MNCSWIPSHQIKLFVCQIYEWITQLLTHLKIFTCGVIRTEGVDRVKGDREKGEGRKEKRGGRKEKGDGERREGKGEKREGREKGERGRETGERYHCPPPPFSISIATFIYLQFGVCW